MRLCILLQYERLPLFFLAFIDEQDIEIAVSLLLWVLVVYAGM